MESCSKTAKRFTRPSSPRISIRKQLFSSSSSTRHSTPEFRSSISNTIRVEGTSLKMNLALDGLPDFTAFPGTPGPQHGATMHICPSIDYVERAWDDAKYGRPSQNPLLEMTCPTIYDPELAPSGQAHHGHLPAVRALHPARRNLGRPARTLRRSRARSDLRIRAQHSPDRARTSGARARSISSGVSASPAATSSTAR